MNRLSALFFLSISSSHQVLPNFIGNTELEPRPVKTSAIIAIQKNNKKELSFIKLLTGKWWVPTARLRYTGNPLSFYGIQYTAKPQDDIIQGEAFYFHNSNFPPMKEHLKESTRVFLYKNATLLRQWCWTQPAYAPFQAHWNITLSNETKYHYPRHSKFSYTILYYSVHDPGSPDLNEYHDYFGHVIDIDEQFLVLRPFRQRHIREFKNYSNHDNDIVQAVASDLESSGYYANPERQVIHRKAAKDFHEMLDLERTEERKRRQINRGKGK